MGMGSICRCDSASLRESYWGLLIEACKGVFRSFLTNLLLLQLPHPLLAKVLIATTLVFTATRFS